MSYTLCLDIGGTNPRIALVDDSYMCISIQELHARDSLVAQINSYLGAQGLYGRTTDTCIIAAAGIVTENGTVSSENSSINIDKQEILEHSLLSYVYVINDFQAIAYATKSDLLKTTSIIASDVKKGNSCVIGPGTGLGISFLFDDIIIPSEGGHSSIPSLYPEFISWLEKKLNVEYICAEMILSGKGIMRLYEWKTGHIFEPHIIAQSKDPLAKTVMNMFMEYLGAFCQGMALTGLCTNIYLAGGILPKNKSVLLNGHFAKQFQHVFHTSRVKFIEIVSVELIDDYNCSLIGCKIVAQTMLNNLNV